MRSRFILIAAAVIVATGLGVGLGIGLGSSGSASATGPGTGVSQATQLASLQTGCQQWLDSTPAEPGTAQWCTDMTQWMSAYMDRYGVGPQMMWDHPGQLDYILWSLDQRKPPAGCTRRRNELVRLDGCLDECARRKLERP